MSKGVPLPFYSQGIMGLLRDLGPWVVKKGHCIAIELVYALLSYKGWGTGACSSMIRGFREGSQKASLRGCRGLGLWLSGSG